MTSPGTSVDTAADVCPHPDAIKRREEAEKRRLQLNAQARRGWWHSPEVPNMFLINTKADLNTALEEYSQRGLVIINYFAPNCVGCKTLFPKLKQIASRNADVSFLKVNVSEEELFSVAESRGVSKVPFFQIMDGDKVVSEFSANLQTVDKLRAEIAAGKSLSLQSSDADVYVQCEK